MKGKKINSLYNFGYLLEPGIEIWVILKVLLNLQQKMCKISQQCQVLHPEKGWSNGINSMTQFHTQIIGF
jgi:hypothetical protein